MQRAQGSPDPIAALRAGRKAALDEIGKAVLDLSQDRVPLDQGDLRDSGKAVTFDSSNLSYGRVSVGYSDAKAAAVHEDMESSFNDGRQAKYLETAVNDSRSRIMRIAARRLRI